MIYVIAHDEFTREDDVGAAAHNRRNRTDFLTATLLGAHLAVELELLKALRPHAIGDVLGSTLLGLGHGSK